MRCVGNVEGMVQVKRELRLPLLAVSADGIDVNLRRRKPSE